MTRFDGTSKVFGTARDFLRQTQAFLGATVYGETTLGPNPSGPVAPIPASGKPDASGSDEPVQRVIPSDSQPAGTGPSPSGDRADLFKTT